jgi:hypothetical protein
LRALLGCYKLLLGKNRDENMARKAFKSYMVRFYAASVEQPDDAKPYRIQDLFRELAKVAQTTGGLCPPTSDGNVTYEIRDLRSLNAGAVMTGVFAVMRDDAPHIRSQDRTEREIPLLEDEGVLEKNHFIYYAATGLIVWQVNRHANHPIRFEQYLTDLAGLERGVVFGDILTRDAWKKLRHGIVKRVEVTIDIPKNPMAFDPDDFTGPTLQTMERAGAQRALVTLSAGRGNTMTTWIREQLLRLKGGPHIDRLQVTLEKEARPLDLLANTVRDTIEVVMNGRYPNTPQTLVELAGAYERQREALRAHFGQ